LENLNQDLQDPAEQDFGSVIRRILSLHDFLPTHHTPHTASRLPIL
jgi:hypothetical protein